MLLRRHWISYCKVTVFNEISFFLRDAAQNDIKNEHFDKALQKYARIRQKYPDAIEGYLAGGKEFENQGNLKQALKLYLQAQKLFPMNIELYTKIGETAVRLGDGVR